MDGYIHTHMITIEGHINWIFYGGSHIFPHIPTGFAMEGQICTGFATKDGFLIPVPLNKNFIQIFMYNSHITLQLYVCIMYYTLRNLWTHVSYIFAPRAFAP